MAIWPRSGLCLWIAASALVGGCSGASDDTRQSVSTALKDGSSAVATARLVLALDAGGKLTTAATSTTLDDALKELETARTNVLQLSPTVQDDRDTRREALTILDESIAGVTTAQDAISSTDGSPTLQDGDQLLENAADRMASLGTQLGGQ